MTSQMSPPKRQRDSDDALRQISGNKYIRISKPYDPRSGSLYAGHPVIGDQEQVVGQLVAPAYSTQHGLLTPVGPSINGHHGLPYGHYDDSLWPSLVDSGYQTPAGQLFLQSHYPPHPDMHLNYQGSQGMHAVVPESAQLAQIATGHPALPLHIEHPVTPSRGFPLAGFPSVEDFDRIVQDYIESLSPKKRDKALITEDRYDKIRRVHINNKDTTIDSAQFRFWAKKMFGYDERTGVVLHERRPVATRERLFDILCKAHGDCQHGGRDKTSAQVHQEYSWVPKELIARFVRECPSCRKRRSSPPPRKSQSSSTQAPSTPKPILTPSLTGQTTPPISDESTTTSPSAFQIQTSNFIPSGPFPFTLSPPASRRTSFVGPAVTSSQMAPFGQTVPCQSDFAQGANLMVNSNLQVPHLQVPESQLSLDLPFGNNFQPNNLPAMGVYVQPDGELHFNAMAAMHAQNAFGSHISNEPI